MKVKQIGLIVVATMSFMVAFTGCASSTEGEAPKPEMSEETKARFQPTETGAAGSSAAQPERSGAPAAPPPGN